MKDRYYSAPASDSVKELIDTLHIQYTKDQAARKSDIRLAQIIADSAKSHDDVSVSLGILVFLFKKIEVLEYRYSSAEKSRYILFFETGSLMYQILKKGLGIHGQNKLDDKSALIYLSALLKHLNNNAIVFSDVAYKNPKALTDDIESVIKKLLANTQNDIDKLIKMRPTAAALKKNLLTIPDVYLAKHPTPGEEEYLLTFLKFIGEKCESHKLDLALLFESPQPLTFGHAVRMGAILQVMSQTADKELLKLCQTAINVGHLADISFDEQHLYLTTLFNTIKNNQEPFILKIKKQLEAQLAIINAELQRNGESHPYVAMLKGIIERSTKFGFNVACGSAASITARVTLGPLATAGIMMGVGLLIDNSKVAGIIEHCVLPEAFKNFVGHIQNQVADVISKTAGRVVYAVGSTTADVACAAASFGASIFFSASVEEIPQENQAWISALTLLPSHVFPAEKKARIGNIEIADAKQETKKLTATM